VLKQLSSALAQIKSANATLDSAAAGWSVPDAPEQPPFIYTLSAIKLEAGHAIDVANLLLATMGK
jgi:hypothetical protein